MPMRYRDGGLARGYNLLEGRDLLQELASGSVWIAPGAVVEQ
jgi:hypothetical protein